VQLSWLLIGVLQFLYYHATAQRAKERLSMNERKREWFLETEHLQAE
jgi:hypothetical protein